MNTVYWICAMVIFLIVEAVTTSMVSVWFALGALAAAICTYFGIDVSTSMVVFALVSALSLVVFKKFYNKNFQPKHEPTNADRLIGAKGFVKKDIEPVGKAGEVDVCGRIWSAKADEHIEKDSLVEVTAIEGVKLVVKKV
ncbi:MAG: NfeD family protein [Clostridia bacterium]